MAGNYFGSVNVGGGWGPPPLEQALLLQDREMATKGLGMAAGMLGGAIGGGIKGGAKGAFEAAAEAGDEEFKRRNQEYKALQQYAEAAHGVPKEISNPMGLDELRGLVRGREFQQVRQDLAEKMSIAREESARRQAHDQALAEYYQQGRDMQSRRQALDEQQAADARNWQAGLGDYVDAYGPEAMQAAIAYANRTAPGGMPPQVAGDLLQRPGTGAPGFQPSIITLPGGRQAFMSSPNSAQLVQEPGLDLEKEDLRHASRMAIDAERQLATALSTQGYSPDGPEIRRLRMNRDHWARQRDEILGRSQPQPPTAANPTPSPSPSAPAADVQAFRAEAKKAISRGATVDEVRKRFKKLTGQDY